MKIAVKSQGAKIDLRHGIVGKVWEKEKEVMGTGRGDRERRMEGADDKMCLQPSQEL